MKKALDKAKTEAGPAIDKAKKAANEAIDKAKKATNDVLDKAKEATNEALDGAKDAAGGSGSSTDQAPPADTPNKEDDGAPANPDEPSSL